MLLAIWLFDDSLLHIVAITFTALVLTELLMIALEIRRWHILMFTSEVASICLYLTSIGLLPDYFPANLILSVEFWWRVLVIVAGNCVPVVLGRVLSMKCSPPTYMRLRDAGL